MKQGTIFWNSMFLVLALAMILSAIITFSSLASAAINITGCYTINSSGIYNLINDFSFSSSPCIKITVSNVILDGQGYKMTSTSSTASQSHIYTNVSTTNITIKNIIFDHTGTSDTYKPDFFQFAIGMNNSIFQNISVVTSRSFSTAFNVWGINITYYNFTVKKPTLAYDRPYLFLNDCNNCSLTNSSIYFNSTGRNMFQDSWTNSIIKNNNFTQDSTGVIFYYSMDNTTVENNIFNKTMIGALFQNQNNVIIKSNYIYAIPKISNYVFGINGASDWNGSKIYNNYIYANSSEILDTSIHKSSTVQFNTTKTSGTNIIGGSYIGGNYYANSTDNGYSQTCLDNNADGICDIPYNISGTGIFDYLPLASHGHVISLNPATTQSLELVLTDFTVIYQVNPSIVSNVDALFYYNGTYYAPTKTQASNNYTFNYQLRLPAVTAAYNQTSIWFYNFTVTNSSPIFGVTLNTGNSSMIVYKPIVNTTNAPGNGEASRFFLCKDEITLASINCNFTSTWNMWAPENYANAYYRTYTNTTYQNNTFYQYPPKSVSNLTIDYNVSAVATGYPIRQFHFTGENANGTNMTKVFLMLSSTDGIYVTFQVLNAQSNNPISGVYVTVNRTSDGGLIGIGTTGPTGTVTFWMNPNTAHTVTFSHPSYPTVIYTDTFTGPAYTVYMGGGGHQNQTNNFTGIYWQVTPATNSVLTTNQKYNFSLFLTSYYSNVSLWGYYLSNGSNIMLAQNWTTVNSTNITTMNFNVSGNETIQMNIYWITDTGIGNATVKWGVGNYYQGNYSIKTFFDDLKLYNSSGTPLFNPFTMSLIAFAIIFLITGALCWVSGIYSPLAIGTMITSLTWFFTWVGMIGSPTARTKYAIPIMLTVLFGAYYIWEQTK